jgi:hypothetical protein
MCQTYTQQIRFVPARLPGVVEVLLERIQALPAPVDGPEAAARLAAPPAAAEAATATAPEAAATATSPEAIATTATAAKTIATTSTEGTPVSIAETRHDLVDRRDFCNQGR